MEVKKRKKLGLSLKTTKKTAVERNIIIKGQTQRQEQNLKQDFILGKDSYNLLQENTQLAACNTIGNDTIIIDDDDPQESWKIAGKTNHGSGAKGQSKTITDYEKGFECDTKRLFRKKLVSKNTDWKILDDLPCQPLVVCHNTSKLSENLRSVPQSPTEMKQTSKGNKVSSLLAEGKVETQSVNKNVEFIYSFYSDLPKPCLVCSTRKPLRVAPFGFVNPTSVADQDVPKSRFFNCYSDVNGESSIKSHGLFDDDEENKKNNNNATKVKILKQKSEYDKAVSFRRAENREKFFGKIKMRDNEVTGNQCFTKRCLPVNSPVEEKHNSLLESFFPYTCNMNTNQELSCNNFTDKSSLSCSGFSIKNGSVATQDACLPENNKFTGFSTCDSTKPLIENSTVVELCKLRDGNIKTTNTEETSYPRTGPGSTAAFKNGKDASISNSAYGQPSFHVGKMLQDDVSSELSSCPMCQQDFPNWTSSGVEDHISNCPGLLVDFIGDSEGDNEIEW